MTLEARDHSIVAQVAAKIAGEITSTLHAHTDELVAGTLTAVIDDYLALVEAIHNDLLERATQKSVVPAEQNALAAVIQAFPGAQPGRCRVEDAPQPVPQAAAPNPRAGGPISNQSTKEELWADVFENPSQWYDNRRKNRETGGRGPDFRHKSIKDKDGKYGLGLWVHSQWGDAPDWVLAALANKPE